MLVAPRFHRRGISAARSKWRFRIVVRAPITVGLPAPDFCKERVSERAGRRPRQYRVWTIVSRREPALRRARAASMSSRRTLPPARLTSSHSGVCRRPRTPQIWLKKANFRPSSSALNTSVRCRQCSWFSATPSAGRSGLTASGAIAVARTTELPALGPRPERHC
jgi:hypothetical protein